MISIPTRALKAKLSSRQKQA